MTLGSTVRQDFKARPGSKHIASAYAIDGLVKWFWRTRPRSVLEVGAGIGTMTSVLIQTLDELHGPGEYRLVSIEDDPFCLEQIDKNLGRDRDKVTVVDRYEVIPEGFAPFDFVVIDGFGPYSVDGAHDPDFIEKQNSLYTSEIARHGVIFVEKDRQLQREKIASALPSMERPHAYCHYQPLNAGPGYHIYWCEPSHAEDTELAFRNFATTVNRTVVKPFHVPTKVLRAAARRVVRAVS